MLRSQNNYIALLLCAILFTSCGFVDLRPIGLTVEPGKSGCILEEPYTPVILKFDTKMKKTDAEGILQISSDSEVVRGDKFWKGNTLYFVPIGGWTAGIRYTLSLSGTIPSVDGRELRLEKFISFFAINMSDPPQIEMHSPYDGESTGTNNIFLEIHFSCPMDRLSVESALSIEGIGNKTYEWFADDSKLKIIPDKALSAWTSYRWNLRDSAKSRDGAPLPKTYSAHFTTNLDQNIPAVEKVFPVLFSSGGWFPTGAEIETGLSQGQAIAVQFNKTMGENALRSIRFEPSLSGKTELLSEKSIVYIFTRDPEPETNYTLIVSGDTRDSEGLKLGADFRINFTPDIPFLKILSFTADGSSNMNDLYSSDNVSLITVDPAAKKIYFSIHFSLPLGIEEMQNSALRISIAPFFPKTLPPVALQYVHWIADDRLRMGWEGFEAGGGERHLYKLTIPGGKGGISASEGIFMKDDMVIFLEAVR